MRAVPSTRARTVGGCRKRARSSRLLSPRVAVTGGGPGLWGVPGVGQPACVPGTGLRAKRRSSPGPGGRAAHSRIATPATACVAPPKAAPVTAPPTATTTSRTDGIGAAALSPCATADAAPHRHRTSPRLDPRPDPHPGPAHPHHQQPGVTSRVREDVFSCQSLATRCRPPRSTAVPGRQRTANKHEEGPAAVSGNRASHLVLLGSGGRIWTCDLWVMSHTTHVSGAVGSL